MDAQQVDVFLQQAAEARELVEARLDALCRFPDDCPQRLQDAIRHSLFAPGKRLRRYWCYLLPKRAVRLVKSRCLQHVLSR